MRFFDLVLIRYDSLASLATRLGYQKIFEAGREIEIIEGPAGNTGLKKIVMSDDFEAITKALRQNDVIGMMPKSASISKKTLEAIKNADAVLFLPVAQVACEDAVLRTQRLVRMRGWVRSALMAKVTLALVSMADSRESIMSSAQMLEVADFLGISQERAKEALARLGGLV